MRVSRPLGVPTGCPRFCLHLLILVSVTAAMCLCAAAASAQTAQFNGALITPGGGNVASGQISGVAVDSAGNAYMGDAPGGQVWKVPLSCIEGTNNASCATKLGGSFNQNYGVAVDASGNVYVADTGNNLVKEMAGNCSSASCVTTLGGSFSAPSGVAVDGSGNVYVTDQFGVEEIPAGCTAAAYSSHTCSTSSLGGGFIGPQALALGHDGNLYIADSGNSAVKEMSTTCSSSSCVSTLITGITSPEGIAIDWYHNLYVTPGNEGAVMLEFPNGCSSSSCAIPLGGSLNGLPTLYLGGVAVDPTGTSVFVSTVYQAYPNNNSLQEIMPHGVNFFSAAVGSTGATRTLTFTLTTGGTIGAPQALTQGATGLDFADAGSGSCDTNGTSYAYSAGDTCTVDVTFSPKYPGVRSGAVNLTTNSGTVIATAYLFGTGTAPELAFNSGNAMPTLGGGFTFPIGIAVDGNGDVYVADNSNSAVTEMPPGCGSTSCMTTLGGGYVAPSGVALDGAGNIYFTDITGTYVKKMPPGCASYTCVTALGGGFNRPGGVAVDASGNVYVADTLNSSIKVMPPGCTSSSCVTILGGSGGPFIEPSGVSVDGQGNVFVGDAPASAAYEIPLSCIQGANNSSCVKTLGSGFIEPNNVAVDAEGNAYVVDTQFGSVFEIPESCIQGANNSSCEITIGSGLVGPQDVVLDTSGNLYVTNSEATTPQVDEITRTTASLSFAGTTAVDAQSSDNPQPVAVQNIGNQTLSFTAPASVTANFQVDDTTDCAVSSTPGTLNAGDSCNVQIDFDPVTAVGTLNGTVTLTDNALNSSGTTHTIDLSGTSTTPAPVTQLAFVIAPPANLVAGGNAGTLTVAEEMASGVTNTLATDTITLTVTGPNGYSATYTSAASSGVATFDVSGVALAAPGTYTYTASFSGLTSAVATETVLASSVNLSSGEPVGTSTSAQPVTLVLQASGTVSTIEVLTQGAGGLDFTAAGTGTCTAGAYTIGQTCTVDVIFTPQYAGLRPGAVVLADGSGTALATAYVYGTGSAPQLVFTTGNAITTLGGGFAPDFGVAVDSSGNTFVADTWNSVVKEIPPGCNSSGCVQTLGGGFRLPAAVAVDGAGNVYVADFGKPAVTEMQPGCASSSCVTTLGGGFVGPQGVAVDAAGNVYVADTYSNTVKEMPAGCTSAACVTTLGGGFSVPSGVAVDAAGNVYVGNYGSNKVQEIPASCIAGANNATCVVTLGGGFFQPFGVALDPAGNVYVADSGNSAIKEIPSSCIHGVNTATCVVTLGGGFFEPSGVAVDPSGNVLVADSQNSLVKEINRTTPPSLSFATTDVDQISSDSPQSVSMSNDGNGPLTFSAIAFGADFRQNTGRATDCSTTTAVASGSGCTLRVTFLPLPASVTGTDTLLNESVTLTDNSPGSPQAVPVSGTVAEAPFGAINAPQDAVTKTATVEQGDNVLITGWAADIHDGAPVSSVSVVIDGTPVGNATLGIANPGIAALYGSRYLDSGWTYSASGLTAGTHTVTAVLYDSLSLTAQLTTRKVTVSSAPLPPYGALQQTVDAITKSTPVGESDGLLVTGWAADLVDGAPVASVSIVVDGTPVGTATLGLPGPAGEPANSGWRYTVASMTSGTHTVSAVAYDSGGRSATLGTHSVVVQANAPPFGAMNPPQDAVTRSTTVTEGDGVLITGWAADLTDGAPVSQVAIKIDGIAVGNATLGIANVGIGRLYGSRYLNSGWTYSSSGLTAGTHTITAVLSDSLGQQTQLTRPINVSP